MATTSFFIEQIKEKDLQVKPKVTLLAYTPDPEKVIAASAKLCYSSSPSSELMDGLTDESAQKFLNMLMGFGHASPIEHASFTFGIEGVSRALTHQLVRHRMASYSQKSQRYVSEDQFDYIIPPEVEANPEAKQEFEQAMRNAQESYDKIAEILTRNYIDQLDPEDQENKSKLSQTQKKAIEDARFVLPNATETMIVTTMNARELLHFFEVRCCNRAQWEIRDLAKQMLALVVEVAPTLFKDAGPACLTGPCPEGNMTCGMRDQVREEFRALKGQLNG